MIEAAMAADQIMLSEFSWDEGYRVTGLEDILTPALVVYPQVVAANIAATLRLLNGKVDRWRPHIKTAKLAYTLKLLIQRGVHHFKCATTLELLTACREGASDVLLAYPVLGANAKRVREIADEFPNTRISVLAENVEQVRQWKGTSIGIYLDINPGMNRTGIEQSDEGKIVDLARAIESLGLQFRGLHYYDGQYGGLNERDRISAAHAGYDRLLLLEAAIKRGGVRLPEIVTAGTPTFPCSLTYAGFEGQEFVHRISPGTIVYNDATSLAQLSTDYGYAPAVLVLTRVVSAPRDGIVTCDAGHKSVSADAGVPTCVVVGHPELTALGPSEEHLPLAVKAGSKGPQVGDYLFLLPRHICPTVNNFDSALLVRDGEVVSVERVTARGREAPLCLTSDRQAPALERA